MSGLSSSKNLLDGYLEQMGCGPGESGSFSVDLRSAHQKMRANTRQTNEIGCYILKFIQAAIAAGASQVELEVGWSEVTLHCSLPGGLSLDRGPIRKHLALGVFMALDQGVQWLAVEIGGNRDVFSEQRQWQEPCPLRPKVLLIRCRRWSFWRPEIHLIRQRCRWAVPVIHLNEEELHSFSADDPSLLKGAAWGLLSGGGPHLVESYIFGGDSQNRLRAPGFSGARLPPLLPANRVGPWVYCMAMLAISPCNSSKSRLFLAIDGVVLNSIELELGIGGLSCILEASDLTTDLMGLRLIGQTELIAGDDLRSHPLGDRIEQIRREAVKMKERYELS